MRDWLVEHGVASARIIMDTQARDTVSNADSVATMLKEKLIRNVVIHTSTFHGKSA
eukprot:SAG31_NODE_9116_length_1331_cov_1.140422_1_plen_56_part_00